MVARTASSIKSLLTDTDQTATVRRIMMNSSRITVARLVAGSLI